MSQLVRIIRQKSYFKRVKKYFKYKKKNILIVSLSTGLGLTSYQYYNHQDINLLDTLTGYSLKKFENLSTNIEQTKIDNKKTYDITFWKNIYEIGIIGSLLSQNKDEIKQYLIENDPYFIPKSLNVTRIKKCESKYIMLIIYIYIFKNFEITI